MVMYSKDQQLIDYVNKAINSGDTKIVVPLRLFEGVNKETIKEVKRLCKLNGVKIEKITDL